VSASEKLRALGLALQTDTPLNYGRVASLNTLGDALPQIVAVIAAAERIATTEDSVWGTSDGVGFVLQDALITLDKELT